MSGLRDRPPSNEELGPEGREVLRRRVEQVAAYFGWPENHVCDLVLFLTDPAFGMSEDVAEGLDSMRSCVDVYGQLGEFAVLLSGMTGFDASHAGRLDLIRSGASPRVAGSGA